jgi:hypothetical protein
MHDKDVTFQLVAPHVHQTNAAEWAIWTLKNHLIAGLSSTDKHFLMSLLDRLIEQGLDSLNLLRASQINPRVSAYSQLNGTFDYNATSMAPPGTRVLLHEKPSVGDHGYWMEKRDGMLDQPRSITDVTPFMSIKPIPNALETQLHSFWHTQPCQHSQQQMQPCKQLRI